MSRATAIIEGFVGGEPELRFTQSGTAVADFSVAHTERRREGDEWVDGDTSWFTITCWSRLAESVAETIDKGSLVIVHGRLKENTWEDKEGNKRSRIVVVADSVGIIPRNDSRQQKEEAPF